MYTCTHYTAEINVHFSQLIPILMQCRPIGWLAWGMTSDCACVSIHHLGESGGMLPQNFWKNTCCFWDVLGQIMLISYITRDSSSLMQSWVHVCGGWCRLISHYQCVVNCEQDCTDGCCFIVHATVNLPHFYWTCMKLQWETSICSACKYSPINFNSYEPDLLEAARPNPEWLLCK